MTKMTPMAVMFFTIASLNQGKISQLLKLQ